jgi:hypothetical protein
VWWSSRSVCSPSGSCCPRRLTVSRGLSGAAACGAGAAPALPAAPVLQTLSEHPPPLPVRSSPSRGSTSAVRSEYPHFALQTLWISAGAVLTQGLSGRTAGLPAIPWIGRPIRRARHIDPRRVAGAFHFSKAMRCTHCGARKGCCWPEPRNTRGHQLRKRPPWCAHAGGAFARSFRSVGWKQQGTVSLALARVTVNQSCVAPRGARFNLPRAPQAECFNIANRGRMVGHA